MRLDFRQFIPSVTFVVRVANFATAERAFNKQRIIQFRPFESAIFAALMESDQHRNRVETMRIRLLLPISIFAFLSGFFAFEVLAHSYRTENVFLVTLDGLRWQELFGGADPTLIGETQFVKDPESLKKQFWAENREVRKLKLLPFFWSVIAKQGQIYGNRLKESYVNTANQLLFSYPGYNEILTGAADDRQIVSNKKLLNPNETVLEFINKQDGFSGRVVAFCSWEVFPFIINEKRSGVPVNAGFEAADVEPLSDRETFLNKLQDQIPRRWPNVRFDAFTHHFALEYIKKHKPRLIYIAYGETDDFAHDGRYDHYLRSAHQTDDFIGELWRFIQSTEEYRDKTTLLIATDHGRGATPKESWTTHNDQVLGSNQTWIAAIGPDTSPLGDNLKGQYFLNQLAASVGKFLGFDYNTDQESGAPIETLFNE